jgi:hypothetical protein
MAYFSDDFYEKTQPNFLTFIDKLEKLSRKYGVVVQGHFDITDNPKEFKNVVYDRDISSSDINARGYWDAE